MTNLFNFIAPIALAIETETEIPVEAGTASFADYAHFLWITPLFGMIMVFSVLIILWGVLSLFKLIFAGSSNAKKVAPKVDVAPKAEPDSAPAPAPTATNDAELIAVLTAAITAYEAEQNPDATPASFRVVSYRRANGGRSWNAK